jgi:DNA repair protein RadC
MKSLKREHLRGLYLNPQGTVIWDEVIAIGSLSKALVSAREIIAPALEHNASGIILAHNHLSGIAEPSIEDSEMTLQIENAMELMKIDLWDHIIIADDNYYSFNEAGKLKLKDKKIAFSVRK